MVMSMLDKLEASARAASCISYLTSVGLVTGSLWEFLNTNAAGFGAEKLKELLALVKSK